MPPFPKTRSVLSRALPGVRLESTLSPELQRAIPAEQKPSADQRAGNYSTRCFTFTTTAGGRVSTLYTASMPWARVKLTMQTAGPVAVSTDLSFAPVNSGKGITLTTDQEIELVIARGSRLYILSPNVNRIRVVIEPVPWLEQILGGILSGFDGLMSLIARFK